MDDYNISSLAESKNEWCARLVNALAPAVIEGVRSIFKEADDLCKKEDQEDKYLMTFQTYLSRIPKWNEEIIKAERERIEERSRCGYLEDLITCVHVVQLKALTCVRVGQKQKPVDLSVPSANAFVHKVYTLTARRLYTSVYLFEKDVAPLEKQKLNRELEVMVKECIMNAIRDSVPVEKILKAYVSQTEEVVNEEGDGPPLPPASAPLPPPAPPVSTPLPPPTPVSAPVPAPTTSDPAPLVSDPAHTSTTSVPAPSVSAPAPPDVDPLNSIMSIPSPRNDEEATEAIKNTIESIASSMSDSVPAGSLRFDNHDHTMSTSGQEQTVSAPKTDAGLAAAAAIREAKEEEEADGSGTPIDDEPIALAIREMSGVSNLPDASLDIEDVEVLS